VNNDFYKKLEETKLLKERFLIS
jgi:hypothetical protein